MPTKPRFKTCVLAVLVAAMPLFADAAGLGRLNVLSGLGQPFKGEIDLLAVQPNEVETLKVNLGSVDAYASAHLAYPASSLGLRLGLEKRSSGQYYVSVTSNSALDEPVFNLLVDLSWAGGKIRRGYTALIDPVGYGAAPAGATATTAPAGTTVTPLPSAASSVDPEPKSAVSSAIQPPKPIRGKKSGKAGKTSTPTATATTASAPEAATLTGDNYTVKTGDTLSSIAGRVKPDGISLEQVLVGLYRANPEAFDGNMNRLKRGKILRLPATGDLDGISKAEAVKEIRIQSGNWQNYRRQLAESAGKAPAAETGEQAAGGRITAKVEDQGAKAADKSKDVLKLSRGASKTNAASTRTRALEEEAATRKKALEEANQRVTQLQSNVKKMEELAALKSKSGAALQQKAEQASTPAAPVATAAPVAASPAASQPADMASAVQAVASVASVAEVVKPKRVAPPPPPPVEEPGILDIVSENIVPIGGGIAAILLAIGGFIWSRNRRKPSVFENSLITSGDLKPNTVLGRTGGGVISTQAENSFLTDFSRQGLGTIDTDEVDPIAEADVYMAYGRNAQAEEILKDALAKDPHRQEIRMKLLDIFAARKDKTAFEEVAADLFSATGGAGSNWDQTVHMGLVIDPNNPLYAGKSASKEAPVTPPPVVETTPAPAVFAPAVAEQALESLTAEIDQKESLDFEFDLPAESDSQETVLTAAPVPQSVSDNISLDLGDVQLIDESILSNKSDNLMELDLPIDLGKELSASEPVSSFGKSELDIPDLDLNLGLGLDAMPDIESAEEAQALAEFNAQMAATEMPDLSLPEEVKVTPPSTNAEPMIDLDFAFKDIQAPAESRDLLQAESPINIDLEMSENAADDLDFGSDDPVQTKIDLARAYIDMGDVEGAREILQEAEQEGSPAQQEQARTLLAGL